MRSWRWPIWLAAAAACVPPTGAQAAGGDRQDATVGFAQTRPGVVTGDFFRLTVKDRSDPNGKPPAIRRIVEVFPRGTTGDPRAIPSCSASDAELMAQGTSACPRRSHFGDGSAELVSGFGPPLDPIELDVQAIFTGHGEANLATERRTGARFVTHTKFEGKKAITDIPPQPGGPPDGQTVLRRTALTFHPQVSKNGRAFVSTPSRCPASGKWRFRLLFTYADGVTQEENPTSPCSRGPRRPRCRLALSIRPRRVHAGARHRFRLRVRRRAHGRPVPVAGAKIWFASKRRHTGHDGRTSVTARFRHPGVRRARASKHGCRAGMARVRVLPARR